MSHPYFDVGLEHFVWQEYTAAGARLLQERGPRLAIGLGLDGSAESRIVYALAARFYVGRVAYDGQTHTGVPLDSDTTYLGGSGEALGGFRMGDNPDLKVLAGLGLDTWRRIIADSVAADGSATSTAAEDYLLFYGKVGVGADWTRGRWRQRWQVGLKAPLSTWEYSENYRVTLAPRGRGSLYGAWDVTRALDGKHRAGARLYYDSYRFSASPSEQTVINGLRYDVWQPESRMDVWGLQFSYGF